MAYQYQWYDDHMVEKRVLTKADYDSFLKRKESCRLIHKQIKATNDIISLKEKKDYIDNQEYSEALIR